jgi:hypothetical protein
MNDSQAKRDEPVVSDEEGQELGSVDQHLEVVDQRLAVEEVVGRDQEIPEKDVPILKEMRGQCYDHFFRSFSHILSQKRLIS